MNFVVFVIHIQCSHFVIPSCRSVISEWSQSPNAIKLKQYETTTSQLMKKAPFCFERENICLRRGVGGGTVAVCNKLYRIAFWPYGGELKPVKPKGNIVYIYITIQGIEWMRW